MADENNLMIEVTGSANKAVSALDKVIERLSNLQATFDKAMPSVTAFTEKLNQIPGISKALNSMKDLNASTSKSALSAKDAESKMAMYQARLDRATASMERSKVASEKLAAARKKLSDASSIDAKNAAAFSMSPAEFKAKYNLTGRGVSLSANSTEDDMPVFAPGSKSLQPDVSGLKAAVGITQKISADTSPALSAVSQMRAYIDSVTPSVSKMSESARSAFEKISTEIMRISSQIDNQRALYSQLASAATKAASANGEGSSKYLQLEKRMLSADGAIDKLIAKQDKLKKQLSGISDGASKSSLAMRLFGDDAKKSAENSASGFAKTLNMMEKMFIRIIAFRIFSVVTKSITDGLKNIAQGSEQANASLSALSTSSLYLKNSIAAAFMPMLESVAPIITQVIDQIASAFNYLAMLSARIFGGATSVTIAKKANVDYAESIAKTGKEAEKAQKAIMGFDELNVLSQNKSGSSASSGTPGMPNAKDMFTTVQIPSSTLAFADKIKTKLQALQPLFNGLTNVFLGFWNAIKSFAENYFYKWLVGIGDWAQANPDVMYNLGKGLGYLAVGILAFKGIKWLANISGLTTLVGWLGKLKWAGAEASAALDTGSGLGAVLAKASASSGWIALAVVALAGLGVGAYALGQKLKEARIKEEFGNISISADDIKKSLSTLTPEFAKIGSALETQRQGIDSFKQSLSDLSEQTKSLYIKVSVDGKIDKGEAEQLKTQVGSLVADVKTYLDKETGYSLSLWSKIFQSDGTVSANEQELLSEISKAGGNAQSKVDEIQQNIQKVIDQGIKNGFLTQDQQQYLQGQMTKLQSILDPNFQLANAKMEILSKKIATGGLTKDTYDSVKSELETVVKSGMESLGDTQIKAYQDVEKQKVLFGISDVQASTLKEAADKAYADGKKSLAQGAMGQYQAMVQGLVADLNKNKQALSDEWGKRFKDTYDAAFNAALGGVSPKDATKAQIQSAVKSATAAAQQSADEGMGDLYDKLQTKNQDILSLLQSTTGDAKDLAQKYGISLPSGFSEGIDYASGDADKSVREFFVGQRDSIISETEQSYLQANNSGSNVVQGFNNGLESNKGSTNIVVSHWYDGILNWLNNLWGIHSPSTVAAESAYYVVTGFNKGISDNQGLSRSPLQNWMDSIKSWFSWDSFRNWAQNAVDGLLYPFRHISWPAMKSPHFSISYDVKGWGADAFRWMGLPGTPQIGVNWYAKGGLFDSPSIIGIGEGADDEAALPLNNNVYSRIGKGIAENGGGGFDTERLISRIDDLEKAIRNMQIDVSLYANDKEIANSASRGSKRIDRSTSPIASTR